MTDDVLNQLGVVIVTYCSADVVIEALAALPADRLGGIIVVDNASSDDTVETVRRVAPRAQVVALSQNLGFGAGCNVGLARLPDARFVLFLNPDARLDEAALEGLIRHLDATPACAMTAPRLFHDGEALSSAGRRATLFTELRYVMPGPLVRFMPERRLPADYARTGRVGYVEGAAMMLRADALRAVGEFDEGYFLFFEEMDLADRLERGGFTVELCGDIWGEHAGGKSRRSVPFAARGHYYASTVRYLRRWRGWASARSYRRVALLSLWLKGRGPHAEPELLSSMRGVLRDTRG